MSDTIDSAKKDMYKLISDSAKERLEHLVKKEKRENMGKEKSKIKMSLVIKNFGQIKNMELDLNRIIVLTGDDWSGATTLLKTIRFLKNIYCRKLVTLEELLKDMKIIGEVEHIGKKIDVEISHNCGDDRGVIGRAIKEDVGSCLREDSLIKFLINDKTVIKIDYNKTVLKKLGKKDLNVCKFLNIPETSLFPTRQIDVADSIGINSNDDIDIVVYTHSPYILSALNNLIYAGMLYADKNVDKDKLKDNIAARYTIEPGIVSAYHIEDGELVNIIDGETGLIRTDKLDEVSFLLEKEFNSLCKLDSKVSKE